MLKQITKHIALAEYFYQLSKQIPIESEQHEQIKILLNKADWHLTHAAKMVHHRLSRPLRRRGFLLMFKINRAQISYNAKVYRQL